MGGSPYNTTAAPWLFSDPYAYRYDDIPDHIRLISDARQQPRSATGEAEQGPGASKAVAAAAGAVEAGSVPIFEMEGSTAAGVATVVPTVAVAGEKREGDSGLRFELEGCGGKGGAGGVKGLDLAKLRITPPNVTTIRTSPGTPVAAAPLAPGCLQVGGQGAKSPLGPGLVGGDAGIELFLAPTNGSSTPSTPTALTVGTAAGNGLPRPVPTYRRPDVVTTNKRITTAIPAVTRPPAPSALPPTQAAEPLYAVLPHHLPQMCFYSSIANDKPRAGVGSRLHPAQY
ncbi:hypothetical protein PG996_007842 [Apiospora saccharicola]|uniref:Uncharacterized protein n=1 Tax=Apiospora saccharicola TaxID=335842 RepID=A0ABR1UWB0_9PEZI